MERFGAENAVDAIKKGAMLRRRVANMAKSTIDVVAKEHNLAEEDVKEAVEVANHAIVEDPYETVEDKLLQVGLDAALRYFEERGLYTEKLSSDVDAKKTDFLHYRVRS